MLNFVLLKRSSCWLANAFLASCFAVSICLVAAAESRPNVVLIMADDLGYSDLGCYGGEIETPHLDALAADGLRYTGFRNTSRCCPSRASLMTGKYQHSVDMGWMTAVDEHRTGYRGQLSYDHPTIAEILGEVGYETRMSGKWHLTIDTNFMGETEEPPNGSWPTQRGFAEFYGGLAGGGGYFNTPFLHRNLEKIPPNSLPEDYYYTTAITQNAVRFINESDFDKPMFLYIAHYAPHRPMEAPSDRVDRCRDRYRVGYDVLRRERFERMRNSGLIENEAGLGEPGQRLPDDAPSWNDLSDEQREMWITEMATYAAMVEIMDDGIGAVVAALKAQGQLENTLILFLSDNGATYEGGLISQLCADLSNTPFRNYKQFVHLGGVASPLIVNWPDRITDRGSYRRAPAHINDILSTCLAAANVQYPSQFNEMPLRKPDGKSLLPTFEKNLLAERTLFWEHQGSRAVQEGKWRLVSLDKESAWELYDLSADPYEQDDLSQRQPDRVQQLEAQWNDWAEDNQVFPLEHRPWQSRIEYYTRKTGDSRQ